MRFFKRNRFCRKIIFHADVDVAVTHVMVSALLSNVKMSRDETIDMLCREALKARGYRLDNQV